MQPDWQIHREQERTSLVWGRHNTRCTNQWTAVSPLQKASWSCWSLKPSSCWAPAWLTAVSSIATNGRINANVAVWPTAHSLRTPPPPARPGLELSFYSGIYGTCIGATAQFGAAAKGLIGISGIVVGVGEIVGELRIEKELKENHMEETNRWR